MFFNDSILFEADREIKFIESKLNSINFINNKDKEIMEKNLSFLIDEIESLYTDPKNIKEVFRNDRKLFIISNLLNCLKILVNFEINVVNKKL